LLSWCGELRFAGGDKVAAQARWMSNAKPAA